MPPTVHKLHTSWGIPTLGVSVGPKLEGRVVAQAQGEHSLLVYASGGGVSMAEFPMEDSSVLLLET